MATEGLRRSGRVRKPVETYADVQPEADNLAKLAPPTKRQKKGSNVDDGEADFVAGTCADEKRPNVKTAKPVKKRGDSAFTSFVEAMGEFTIGRVVKRRGDFGGSYEQAPDLRVVEKRGNFGGGYEGMPDENAKVVKKRVKKAGTADPDGDLLETSQPAKKGKKPARKPLPDWHADAAATRIARESRKIKMLKAGHQEKRLRSFVDEPDDKYAKALKAASSQRMYVIDRERFAEENCHAHHTDCPTETIQLAGSTGNVYTVTISHMPTCTCPVGLFQRRGEQSCCKHVLYVLHNVLKAPNDLLHQNAFLSSELREIFAGSPALSSEIAEEENTPTDGNRKELGGDCPICFTEFEQDEDITYCRAACGNNIHKACFDQWERTKPGKITCPFCRAPWQAEDAVKNQKVEVANITMPQERQAGGYQNVRHLLEYDE